MLIPVNFTMRSVDDATRAAMGKFQQSHKGDYVVIRVGIGDCARIAIKTSAKPTDSKAAIFFSDAAHNYVAFEVTKDTVVDGTCWLHDGLNFLRVNPLSGKVESQPIRDFEKVSFGGKAIEWKPWSAFDETRFYLR